VRRLGRTKGQRNISRRAKLLIGASAALVIGLTGALAFAYFTSTGRGSGAATVSSLGSPALVTGSPSGSTVAVSWAAVTDLGSGTFGYYVTRTPYPSGSPVAVCSSSPTSLLSGTSCNDTSVPSGNYTYSVTVVYNSWSNSASSGEVTVANIAPAASAPSVSATTNYGTNPYWVNEENVTLTDTPTTNGGSAIASVSYYYCKVTAAPCNSGNWLPIGSTSGGGTWSVVWALTSPPSDGTYDVVAIATNTAALNSAVSTATEIGVDTTGPVVSAPSISATVTYGSNPIYVNNENVALTETSVSDVGSGVKSVAYYYCAGSSGTCTTTLIGTSSSSTGNYPVTWTSPLPVDGPYRIEVVATDNVTNTTTSSATLVFVDKTPPTVSAPSVNGFS
jgi:hypothetical protein